MPPPIGGPHPHSAHVITALQTILSREIAPTQTGVLGLAIQGGTA